MWISILGLKKTMNIVESFLHGQPPSGIIRTTAEYFFLPHWTRVQHFAE
jgi:hypothetical protein